MNPFGGFKILHHLDRVAVWQSGNAPAPITVEFDPSGRCNHKCQECCGGYRGTDVPFESAENWLKQMADYGVRGVMLTGGGEPTMHPRLVDIAACAFNAGMDVGLITNGTAYQGLAIYDLVRYCKWIRVSIDCGDPELYSRLRGVGEHAFQTAWDAVAAFSAARDVEQAQCTIGVGTLLDVRTAASMGKAAALARDSGADYLQLRPFIGGIRTLPPAVLASCKTFETPKFRVLTSDLKYDDIAKRRTYQKCHGAWFTGVVQADGNMPLCCHLRGKPEWYIGNLEDQTFQELWDSPKHAELVGALDVSGCPLACRNHPTSEWLEASGKPLDHENFV